MWRKLRLRRRRKRSRRENTRRKVECPLLRIYVSFPYRALRMYQNHSDHWYLRRVVSPFPFVFVPFTPVSLLKRTFLRPICSTHAPPES
jgi:hypothetical protein